jgi:hypothetical protein
VSFEKNGKFFQMDSLFGHHGSWFLADSGSLKINSAGKGFENFNGEVSGMLNDTILIEELIKLDNEKIKLIWHLKKIGRLMMQRVFFKDQIMVGGKSLLKKNKQQK